jgi:hypothetical protein
MPWESRAWRRLHTALQAGLVQPLTAVRSGCRTVLPERGGPEIAAHKGRTRLQSVLRQESAARPAR